MTAEEEKLNITRDARELHRAVGTRGIDDVPLKIPSSYRVKLVGSNLVLLRGSGQIEIMSNVSSYEKWPEENGYFTLVIHKEKPEPPPQLSRQEELVQIALKRKGKFQWRKYLLPYLTDVAEYKYGLKRKEARKLAEEICSKDEIRLRGSPGYE